MKLTDRFKLLPVLLRVLIYLGINYGLLFISQIITGFLPLRTAVTTNIVLCILLILFTWLILRWENMSWKEIGCTAGGKKGAIELLSGTIYGIVMLISVALTIKLITGFEWVINPAFNWPQLLPVIVTVAASVFVQELAFRGYPFHLLLKKWREWPAQIVVALLFGAMHFSHGMSATDILLTMITTGTGSLLFGIAVIKTKRLHLAIGIHFGWNLLQLLLPRSVSQNGEGIWLVTGGSFNPAYSLLIWVLPYMIAAVALFAILRMSIRRSRPI